MAPYLKPAEKAADRDAGMCHVVHSGPSFRCAAQYVQTKKLELPQNQTQIVPGIAEHDIHVVTHRPFEVVSTQ